MKAIRVFLIILAAAAIGLIISLLFIGTAKADSGDVIDLTPVPVEVPDPIPYEDPRPVVVVEHQLNEKDVERIARLIWGSPAKTKESKMTLVWCVLNRLNEPTGFFGSSVREVVNQSEFSWFDPHDHRSEANLQLVRDTWNQYLTWKEQGGNVGPHPSCHIYYIRSSDADRTILEGSEHLSPWKTLGWVK